MVQSSMGAAAVEGDGGTGLSGVITASIGVRRPIAGRTAAYNHEVGQVRRIVKFGERRSGPLSEQSGIAVMLGSLLQTSIKAPALRKPT